MIKKSSLEQLKATIDIVDVLGNYVEFRKSGANFKACCPFHGETTASFTVSPSKQIYHCFGCGVGGDAIKFVQDYSKLNFQEAVEKIASDMNFTLEYENSNFEKKDYATIFEVTNKLYEDNLKDEKLQYLLDRGLTLESIKKFELGYAPRSDKQISHLRDQHISFEDCVDVGVLAIDKDKLYARQIERITFPIRNHLNKLIGFGGRTLKNSKDIAKYINSPETKLYSKSKVFYGFNHAKEHIYKKQNIIIVEGNIDVIMMHQVNLNTTVATMGTALTKEHIIQIKKANARAILCFDGDIAGKKAAYKASMLLSQSEIDGGVVIFEDGVDPSDMIKDDRTDELYALIKKPINIVKYVLNYIASNYDLTNPIQKTKVLKECVEYLKTLNPIVANEYKGYLANLLNIESYHIILGQVSVADDTQSLRNADITKADEKFIKTLIEKPDYMDFLFTHLDYRALDNKYFKAVFENENEDILRPITIRDDIVIYNQEDFLLACKLKQKHFLESELKKLTLSIDDDVFAKMDYLRAKLNNL